jgi:hypothetical protein
VSVLAPCDSGGASLTPGDNVEVAGALVFALGEEWLRGDMLARLEIAYGWLAKGGRAVHVADELRRIADDLDTEPVSYMQARIGRLIADLSQRVQGATA